MAPSAVAELKVVSDFEAGSIGECRTVGENHLECGVKGETDQDGRNRQASWYYFRLEGGAGSEVTIDLVDLAGEYNYKPNKGSISDKTPPWVSTDRKEWTSVAPETLEYDPEQPRLRIRLTPEQDPVWIAHVPPYTTEHLDRLMEFAEGSKYMEKEVIGKTVGGRDLLLLTFTQSSRSPEQKKVVWLMFRQHSWEAATSWAAEGAIRFLLSNEPAAAKVRLTGIIKILPMCDPDGVARGGVRFNANGYDLNRNWDTIDAEKMPEIAAQHKAVADWLEGGNRLDLFVTLHNTETAEYLAGPPEGSHPLHGSLLGRLFNTMLRFTSFSATREPAMGKATTTDGRPGRMTVVQGLSKDFDAPAFLIERRIADHPKLRHPPTADERARFGRDLVITGHWAAPRPPTRVKGPGEQ
jgi:zinc carboxypeptidase/carboxypeptidase M14-like protein